MANHTIWKKRLKQISNLKEGWNGDDSKPILKSAIDLAKKIITQFPFQSAEPEVGTVEDGSLDLNWISLGIYCIISKKKIKIHLFETNSYSKFNLTNPNTDAKEFITFLCSLI